MSSSSPDPTPPNPFKMSPGMAKMNHRASGCALWLAWLPVIVFVVVFIAVAIVLF